MKQYNITFRGYRRDIDRDMLPTFSGIYLVYCYSEHGAGKEATLNRLIYVGKAFNIRDEICDEKLHKKFEKELLRFLGKRSLMISLSATKRPIRMASGQLIAFWHRMFMTH